MVNGITITCWYSIILRVFYNVKFMRGGIHVREAFIRSLMVGGGGAQKHFFDRVAHSRASFKYPKM